MIKEENRKLLFDAIGNISEDLIEAASQAPCNKLHNHSQIHNHSRLHNRGKLHSRSRTSNRKRTRLKWATAAVCICLITALPALAASGSRLLVRLLPDAAGWVAETEETFSVKDFSRNVRELSARLGTENGYYPLESIEETEEFVGILLPDNTVLSEADRDTVFLEVDGERIEGHCIVNLINNTEQKLVGVHIMTKYRLQGTQAEILYNLTTDLNPNESSAMGVLFSETDQAPPANQTHTTPSGLECTIFSYSFPGYASDTYLVYGYTMVAGIPTEIRVLSKSEETAMDCMIRVLNGY